MSFARSLTLAMLLALVSAAVASDDDITLLHKRKVVFPLLPRVSRDNYQDFRLFASEDEGRSWLEVAQVDPNHETVVYFAPGDGLYWFMMQAVMKDGTKVPNQPVQFANSGLVQKVQIDTSTSSSHADSPVDDRDDVEKLGIATIGSPSLIRIYRDPPESLADQVLTFEMSFTEWLQRLRLDEQIQDMWWDEEMQALEK
jgi:hypothetical protein